MPVATTSSPAPRIGKSTVPPVSQNQRAAMASAAAGKSTLGIPAKVGREFMAVDKGGKLPKRKKVKHKGMINR